MAHSPSASIAMRLSPPWHYRLAKWLSRRHVRGCGLVIRGAERLGLLNCVVRYPVAAGLTIDVPLYRRANQWDARQIQDYESQFLDCMAAAARGLGGSFSFVDCGA